MSERDSDKYRHHHDPNSTQGPLKIEEDKAMTFHELKRRFADSKYWAPQRLWNEDMRRFDPAIEWHYDDLEVLRSNFHGTCRSNKCSRRRTLTHP